MDANYIYEIFETTRKNDAPDLNVGLAMLKVEQPIPDEEDKAIREFMGRHYEALVEAYQTGDREAFAAAVAACEAEDEEDTAHDGDTGEAEGE